MARPTKTGLDYFPMDITMDDNLELLEAEHGLQGFAIVVKLWQKIYSAGYFIEWNDDNELLFAKRINAEITLIKSVINTCFKRGLLDDKLYKKYKILTSSGIQKRYFSACKISRRTNVSAIKEYLLVNSEFTDITAELISINTELSTQSKVKEIKVKDKKEARPTWNEFKEYAANLPIKVSENDLLLKYNSWIEQDWCVVRDNKLQPILRWKATLLNTLRFMKPIEQRSAEKQRVGLIVND